MFTSVLIVNYFHVYRLKILQQAALGIMFLEAKLK